MEIKAASHSILFGTVEGILLILIRDTQDVCRTVKLPIVQRKIWTHLDLLSISHPGGKMSKRSGGIWSRSSVCVCVFSSHSFWTSSSLDVPAGVTQDLSSTFFLRCVPLFFSREGFSLSFPSNVSEGDEVPLSYRGDRCGRKFFYSFGSSKRCLTIFTKAGSIVDLGLSSFQLTRSDNLDPLELAISKESKRLEAACCAISRKALSKEIVLTASIPQKPIAPSSTVCMNIDRRALGNGKVGHNYDRPILR